MSGARPITLGTVPAPGTPIPVYPWNHGDVLYASSLNAAIANAGSGTAGAPVISTITAAGTTQGTAAALTGDINVVTSVAAGTGVILSGTAQKRVLNRGANPLLVYPQTSGIIESLAANAAVTVAVGGDAMFIPTSSTQWYAA